MELVFKDYPMSSQKKMWRVLQLPDISHPIYRNVPLKEIQCGVTFGHALARDSPSRVRPPVA